jgi:hypothetical protein
MIQEGKKQGREDRERDTGKFNRFLSVPDLQRINMRVNSEEHLILRLHLCVT